MTVCRATIRLRGRRAGDRRRASWLAALAGIPAFALAPAAAATSFRIPSSCTEGCMTVTAYYDYGGVRDWTCGSNTYAGHRGTDFAPFGSWTAMDEGRSIVAAADGEVIAAHDGEFDRCDTGDCAGGSGFGNYVAVQHADGKVTYYGHMRTGTVRVGVGDPVTCGQELGLIGSSGHSTGPHVHFEVRPGGSAADDPFGGGDCSGPLSYWVEQGAYRALPGAACEASTPAPTDAATVVSVTPEAGAHLVAGSRFEVRIVMRNTGNTTWTDGENVLLAHDGDERFEGPEQVRLDGASIGPDATHELRFDAVAPAASGEHVGYWRMDRSGSARFGDRAEVRIVVDEASPPPPVDAGSSSDGGGPSADGGRRDDGGARGDAAMRDAASARPDGGSGARVVDGDTSLSGGCGCAVPGAEPREAARGGMVLAWLAAAAAALRRRSATSRRRRAG